MTHPPEPEASLSERLREAVLNWPDVFGLPNIALEAAAELDAKDAEIARLRQADINNAVLFREIGVAKQAAEARAEAAEATIARLGAAGIALADACAAYRDAHDRLGEIDMRTGRAWDQMRRAEQELRAALSPAPDQGEVKP